MTVLYEPISEDLWFRQKYLADEDTMSYNKAWGGTISFPESDWKDWYDYWIIYHENKRFYRYLQDSETRSFIPENRIHRGIPHG